MTDDVVYTLYNTITGKILQVGVLKDSASTDIEDFTDRAFVLGIQYDGVATYMPGGVPTDRPTLPIADTSIVGDGAPHVVVASGVPAGSAFRSVNDAVAGDVVSGVLSCSAAVPGEYACALHYPWPTVETQFTITVT